MEAFNAAANVRDQREAAYGDRYVTVVPHRPLQALRLKFGGELHYDDGSIVRLVPGDWAVELPDGTMGRIEAATFADNFKMGGKDEQFHEARQQVGIDPPDPAPEPEPEPEDAKEAVRRAHEETNRLVEEWAQAAWKGKLIDAEERDWMIANNDIPEGVKIQQEGDEWRITREGGKGAVGSLAKPTDDAGQPRELRDLTNAELRVMLDHRGTPWKPTDNKARLLELLDLPEAQVIVGAETAETAANDPQPPQDDPVNPDPTPDEDVAADEGEPEPEDG